MSDKIVYTVSGYKLLKELQNEILEENELESKFQNSELQKSQRKDLRNKASIFSSQQTTRPKTIIFTELTSPKEDLYSSMKDNLNITSLLLKNQKPNTATVLTNERLKTLTMNSNFSTTNNFFGNKQTNQTQNLDVTTLSRIVIRNSKKNKVPINVNLTRSSMIPAGHTQLPSIIKDEIQNNTRGHHQQNKNELFRLKHDEAKLEKIIASNSQKAKEFQEIDDIVKKKLFDRGEYNREYFNKKDQFWRNFFDTNKVIEQIDFCNDNFNRRMNGRIEGLQNDKYKKIWMKIHVGKNKAKKSSLAFGREDLRGFEELFFKLKKSTKNMDEAVVVNNIKEEKKSKTNISKISSETRVEKD